MLQQIAAIEKILRQVEEVKELEDCRIPIGKSEVGPSYAELEERLGIRCTERPPISGSVECGFCYDRGKVGKYVLSCNPSECKLFTIDTGFDIDALVYTLVGMGVEVGLAAYVGQGQPNMEKYWLAIAYLKRRKKDLKISDLLPALKA